MRYKMDEEKEPTPEQAERNRNCQIAINLLRQNSRDSMVIYTGFDGGYAFEATSNIFALGAARKAQILLENDARNSDE